MKKSGVLLYVLLALVATVSGQVHAASTEMAQARLRVTADATTALEHVVLPDGSTQGVSGDLAIAITVERAPDDQITALIWRVENVSGSVLRNVRLFPMIDIDLDAAGDTFMDELAFVSELGLHRAAALVPDAWDAGELGYWHGNLLTRVRDNALLSPEQVVAAEDQTLAWRFNGGDWLAGSVATIRLDVSATPTAGIYLENSDARRVYVEAQLALTLPENIAPTIALTAPVNGSTVDIGAVVAVTAAAADSDGAITQVEFFANGTSIGLVNGAGPHAIDYTASTAGTIVFTAVATDDRGGSTTSAAVTVTVRAENISPTINLTAPAEGSTVDIGAVVAVTASATDSDGTITQVEFFANGASIGLVSGAGPHAIDYTASTAGTIVFTAVATDERGGSTTSAAVTVTVRAENVAPTINLTAPADASTVDIGAVVVVTAAATDSDGTVIQVEFFANGASIGLVAGTGPHAIDYTASAAGTIVFTAVATDDRGGSTTSAAISINVRAENIAPTITLSAPGDDSTVDVGAVVAVTAAATDSDGSITQVEFFANGASIGLVSGAGPHAIDYTASTAGTIVFTAVATDDRGGSTTSAAVSINVRAENIAPTINLTAPGDDSTVDIGAVVAVTAAATDSDGAITQVEFFANGTSIGLVSGAGPHAVDFTASAAGTISFTAVATDDRGGTTTSAAASINVRAENIAPTINLTAPGDGGTVDIGAVIAVTAAASDSDGTITQVEFFANGTSIGLVSGAGPHAIDYTAGAVGTVVFTAVATDDRGGTTTSAAVSINVRAENIAPTINLTAPGDGGTVDIGALIAVTAAATDSDGSITQVEFFANGASIGLVNGAGPHAVDFTASAAGTISFTAVATDDRGGTTTSAAASINVRAENIAPTINLTAPGDGGTVDIGAVIAVTAAAADSDGSITQVEFFANGTSIGLVNGAGPHAIDFTAGAAGTISFTAVATDDRGGTTTSAAVSINVRAENIAPTINLTAPGDGGTVDIGALIAVTAAATDSDGSITQVEFFANGASIGLVNGAGPHAIDYTASAAGTVVFAAVATDDRGGTTTSAVVNVTVRAENIAPTIALTAPVDGSTVDVGAVVTVTVSAADSDGSISQVEFFANGTSIGLVNGVGPHAIDYTATTAGNVVFTAIATDDRGGTTTSAPVAIVIRIPNAEFDVSTGLTRDHRVLVFMSCTEPAPPQSESQCITERSIYLHELLGLRGIEHRIVYTDADFLAALRCGVYNTYWISGGVGKLTKPTIDEIGANLLHGHALIVDARHDERNHGLDVYLGAQSTGRFGNTTPGMTWTSGSGRTFGFPSVQSARRAKLNGAQVLGTFNSSSDAALVRHQTGLGTALWFAFDWVGAARASVQDQNLFDHVDALFAAAPVVLTEPLAAGTQVGLTSVVRNDANAPQTLTLQVQWPQGLTFVAGLDEPVSTGNNTATWEVLVAANSERAIDWNLRLPSAGGEFVVEAVVSDVSGLNVAQEFQVQSQSATTRANAARTALLAMALHGQSAAKRNLAVRAIEDSLAAISANQTSTALGKALDAIGRTNEISAPGTTPVLVNLGMLVRGLEAALCQNSQPLCPTGVTAPGSTPFAAALPDAGWRVSRQQSAFVQRIGSSLTSGAQSSMTLASGQTYQWKLSRDANDRLVAQVRNAAGAVVGEAQSTQALIYGNALRVSGSGQSAQVSLAATAVDGVAIGTVPAAMSAPQLWLVPNWQLIEGTFTLGSAQSSGSADFAIQWQAGELACRKP